LLWLCCCGDYIIPKRGGHCFFIFKSGVIPENTRFLIKNGVSDLTLPIKIRRKSNESING
ncbi:hypothetical protein, partial [[Clostridium] symbiosum]|uniref:hypothetical protein n=1 Tax=Clostridium symbiosum TaxID=1512 RepID=UPI001A9BEC77